MAVIIDGTTGVATPGVTDTGDLSVAGTTTLTTPLPVTSGGTGATSLSGITTGTATNLAGGAAGTIPYQSTVGTTAMLATGASGQLLTSGGPSAAPTWSTLTIPSPSGGATVTNPMSSNVTLTSSSNRVQVLTPNAQSRTITLPNATTISTAGGPIFELQNTVSEYPIAVLDSSGTNIGWVVADYQSSVYLTSTATATGNWVIKTGNPAADGGIYPYGASYGLTGTAQVSRSIGLGLSKNIAVGLTGGATTSIRNFTMVSTPTSRAIGGGDQQGSNFNPSGYQYFVCVLSSTLFFVIYQDTTNSLTKCYATSVSATGTTTKGTELTLNSTNNAIQPFCTALSSTSALVYFNGPNASNFAIAQVITISGTTCSEGAILGSSSNVVGASLGTNASIAALSSTKAHFVNAGTVYSVSISGTTPSLAGSAAVGYTTYGVVPVSATQSMVIVSDGAGGVAAIIATDSAGTVTFGPLSASFLPNTGLPSVSIVQPGVALVLCGANGNTNAVGEVPFAIIRNVSGTPTLVGRGYLPATMQSQNFMGVLDGVSAVPIVATNNASGVTSYQYKKVAITGGV